jgi:hypothetical protein
METEEKEIKTNWNECLSDLPEGDRKAVEEKIKMLRGLMRECEAYLQGYADGKTTVFKFLSATTGLDTEMVGLREDLIAKHKLPGWPPRR